MYFIIAESNMHTHGGEFEQKLRGERSYYKFSSSSFAVYLNVS